MGATCEIREIKEGRTEVGENIPWVSIGEAAKMLGRHPETVRRFLREGVIRGRRLTPRGNRQVDANSIQELLAISTLPLEQQNAIRASLIRHNKGEPD